MDGYEVSNVIANVYFTHLKASRRASSLHVRLICSPCRCFFSFSEVWRSDFVNRLLSFSSEAFWVYSPAGIASLCIILAVLAAPLHIKSPWHHGACVLGNVHTPLEQMRFIKCRECWLQQFKEHFRQTVTCFIRSCCSGTILLPFTLWILTNRAEVMLVSSILWLDAVVEDGNDIFLHGVNSKTDEGCKKKVSL